MFNPEIGRDAAKKGVGGSPGGRPKSRLLSEALRTQLAEVKPDDPGKRTWDEIVAANVIEIARSEGPGAVHAANEIIDRIESRPPQHLQVSDSAADLQTRSDAELQFFLDSSR